jgi:hypothetical protein
LFRNRSRGNKEIVRGNLDNRKKCKNEARKEIVNESGRKKAKKDRRQ